MCHQMPMSLTHCPVHAVFFMQCLLICRSGAFAKHPPISTPRVQRTPLVQIQLFSFLCLLDMVKHTPGKQSSTAWAVFNSRNPVLLLLLFYLTRKSMFPAWKVVGLCTFSLRCVCALCTACMGKASNRPEPLPGHSDPTAPLPSGWRFWPAHPFGWMGTLGLPLRRRPTLPLAPSPPWGPSAAWAWWCWC